jgi:uncharacterized protein
LSWFRTLFTYLPFAVWLVTVLVYVVPCRYRTRVQAIWAMVLLACAAKFLCYKMFGGDVFVPELPEKLIWFWNWAYSGAMILFVLSSAWFAVGLVLRNFITASPRALTVRRWALPVAAWMLSAWGLWNGVGAPTVREVELAIPGLPAELDGYRICHLADIHVSSGARRWRTERIVAAANAAGADLIVCSGDIVDGTGARRQRDVEPIRNLAAKDGVWFVTGNHEYYNDWSEWKRRYDRWGIRFLSNTCVFPRPKLALGGVNDDAVMRFDGSAASDCPNVGRAFACATNGEFRVLLSHRPADARRNAVSWNVGLQLSGHTHGGVMPILDRLVARHNNGFVHGAYPMETGLLWWLHVSPGCGQWAGFPVRFFNDPEISVITLRRNRLVR